MLLGATELRAAAPLGACAASGSAVPATAFTADDARPRARTTRGTLRALGFFGPVRPLRGVEPWLWGTLGREVLRSPLRALRRLPP